MLGRGSEPAGSDLLGKILIHLGLHVLKHHVVQGKKQVCRRQPAKKGLRLLEVPHFGIKIEGSVSICWSLVRPGVDGLRAYTTP